MIKRAYCTIKYQELEKKIKEIDDGIKKLEKEKGSFLSKKESVDKYLQYYKEKKKLLETASFSLLLISGEKDKNKWFSNITKWQKAYDKLVECIPSIEDTISSLGSNEKKKIKK